MVVNTHSHTQTNKATTTTTKHYKSVGTRLMVAKLAVTVSMIQQAANNERKSTHYE